MVVEHVGAPASRTMIRMALKPGLNEVEQEVWDAVKTNPRLQARIEQGELEIVSETNDRAPKLRPQDAEILVGETADAKVLGKWQQNETRTSVRNAISEQVSAISGGEEPRKRKWASKR